MLFKPEYKVKPNLENEICWNKLSQNPNAIPILEKNLDKVDWSTLSRNPNAIHILEKNLYKVCWSELSGNPNAIHILEKNLHKVCWFSLSSNINAIPIIEKNLHKVCWSELSGNPNAIHILEKNLHKVNWDSLSTNPNAIPIIEKNLHKVCWLLLSDNPNAISILEKNLHKVDWFSLSKNPNAISILEKNLDKVYWLLLSKNPNAIHILEKNLDKLDKDSWDSLSSNPNAIHLLFNYDYELMKKNNKLFSDELSVYVSLKEQKKNTYEKGHKEMSKDYKRTMQKAVTKKENIRINIPNEELTDEEDESNINSSAIPIDNINICFVGGVSTGKSTILNAIFCEELTQCKIKRTTMVPTVYIENENNSPKITPTETIFNTISKKNADLIEKSENNTKTSIKDYDELVFNVGKLDINILSDSYVNVYDIPGLNDARTKNIYYKYLDDNFQKFNLFILLIDIHSGLNTSDEVDIVNFITNNTLYQKSHNNKQIYTLVVVNKADDMQLVEEDGDELELTGELKDMFEQTEKLIKSMFNEKKISDQLIGFIPLCAIDAYLYRMVKKHGKKFKLSPQQILKIGINEEGKKFSKLKPSTQEKRVYEKLEDETFINLMIKLSGFSYLESILHMFLNKNNTGKEIRINNLLDELKKYRDISELFKTITHDVNGKIQINKFDELIGSYMTIYNKIKNIDNDIYTTNIRKFVEKFNNSLNNYINTKSFPEDIIRDYDVINDKIIKKYLSEFINVNQYPEYVKNVVTKLIFDKNNQVRYCETIDGIVNVFKCFEKINNFKPSVISEFINIIITNVKGEKSIKLNSNYPKKIDELIQFLIKSRDLGCYKLKFDLSCFMRFIIINYCSDISEEELVNKLFIFKKFGEITISLYLTNKLSFLNRTKNNIYICPYIYGLDTINFNDFCNSNKLELFYLTYEMANNKLNIQSTNIDDILQTIKE